MRTLTVPYDMHVAIEYVPHIDFGDQLPIFSKDLGEQGTLSIYANHDSPNTYDNPRATMIAEVAQEGSTNPPVITGDVFIVCHTFLANKLIASDEDFQQATRSIRAFRTWLLDYSTANSVEPGDVLGAVMKYGSDIFYQAQASRQRDMVESIAEMLGIDPESIGVINL
jgi:phosphodiesterase/alkaline phosphatase D-like protein